MKFLLLLSVILSVSVQAASWVNHASVSFNQTQVVGAFQGGVPLSSVPSINYLTNSHTMNFDNCQYRIKAPSASQLNESFTSNGNGWAASQSSGSGATYFNLDNYLKYGAMWRISFHSISEGTINLEVKANGNFTVSLVAPIASQINAATNPGYYKVAATNLIIQSACEPVSPTGPVSSGMVKNRL